MKKVVAGLLVTFVTALMMTMGLASSAQAESCQGYDKSAQCPLPQVKPASVESGNSANGASSGILPNTGGPQTVLLIGGVALLAVGGTAVVAARRRQTH